MEKLHTVTKITNTWQRLKIIYTCLAFAFACLTGRLCWISLKPAASHELAVCKNVRAEIFDRNGRTLASSIQTFSVYVHPKRISCKKEAVDALKAIFPSLAESVLYKTLSSSKSFAWIIRHITPEQKLAVQALGMEGIQIKKDCKRIYPHGNLFCHLVGMTDVDQQGISGLEKFLNTRLITDQKPVLTTLDLGLQHLIHDGLSKQIQEFQAEAGNAILLDIHTGEILAMVSLPDFSPTNGVPSDPKALFNRNVSGVYEFGSIMKIHNVAAFLHNKKGTLSSVFDASHPLRIGKRSVTDFRGKNRPLTVMESFIYSSNIANAKIALAVGGKLQREFFKEVGLIAPVNIELPEHARVLMPSNWSQPSVMTAGYGYGFAVTPMHVVQSIKTIISGHLSPMTLLLNTKNHGTKVVSSETSTIIAKLLGDAVIDGQAKNASATYCRVGAKTGTANLRILGQYAQKENLTSCVSVFPIDKPRYILLVSIERPKPNAKTHYFATAGWIAAPLASRLVDQIVPLLGLLEHPRETKLVENVIDRLINNKR